LIGVWSQILPGHRALPNRTGLGNEIQLTGIVRPLEDFPIECRFSRVTIFSVTLRPSKSNAYQGLIRLKIGNAHATSLNTHASGDGSLPAVTRIWLAYSSAARVCGAAELSTMSFMARCEDD
jgi:hypothetical protein